MSRQKKENAGKMNLSHLRDYMAQHGLTQKEILILLAQRRLKMEADNPVRTKVTKSWLSLFINEHFSQPSYVRLWAIADVLGVTVDFVIGRNSDPTAGLPPKRIAGRKKSEPDEG